MKKLLSFVLSLVMIFSVMAGFDFTVQAATSINNITIQEVTIPRPGAKPSTTWSKTGVSWEADGIKWYEVPTSGYDIPLSSDSKFVAGKKYKVSVVAWANSSYEFAAPSSLNATIDGFGATVSQYAGRDTKRVVLVSYTFTCDYKAITSVTLTADPFAKGTVLTSDFFYAQGEGVEPVCVSTFTRNGETIAIGEKVTYGNYGANVILAPKENYKFADNVSVTMGGKVFTVAYKIGMGIVVKSADDLWNVACPHSYGTYQYDATTHWKDCSICGDKTNVDGHNFSESTVSGNTVYTCTTCNYVKTAKNKVDGYTYADVTGGVQIIAYDGGQTNLNVPSILGGKTVVSIGDYAFAKYANKTTFTSITLPSTVTSIGKGAFDGCTALSSVNIPSGVKRIEAETFFGCVELKNITIPYGVNFIGESAFQGCGIYSIVIPCSVKAIRGSAFRSCTNLGSIVIPDSVTELGNAFLSCTALKTVVIGSGITSLGQATFDGCKAIETLTIPVELTTIGKYNFDSGSVKKVNYRGTEAQYAAISISTNTDLTSATKTYNYSEKTDIGQHKYIVVQTVAPTCIDKGYTLHMCEGCGDAFQSNVKNATGVHDYNSGVITTEPTCEGKGVKTHLCNNCGASKTTDVNAKGHNNTKNTTVKATLTKNGYTLTECSVCGKDYKKTTIYRPYTFKLSTTSYTYNGKTKSPSVTVKDSKGTKLKKNTDYTVKYASGRKNVGKYKVTITFKGKYSGTKTLYFKINPVKTSVKKLTAGKKSLKVSITKKSTQVTGYQIQYSTSKNFKGAKTKTIKSYKTTSTTLKSLKAKKTYYVRVRTYKTVKGVKYYSGWSTYKYKKTK